MVMVAEATPNYCKSVPKLDAPMYRVFTTTPATITDSESANAKSTDSIKSNPSSAPFSPDVLPVLDAAGFRLVPMEPVEIALHLTEDHNEVNDLAKDLDSNYTNDLEELRRKRLQRLNMPLIYRMYESQSEEIRGTIRGPDDADFHPEEASKALRNALAAGIQSDDKTIINVLLAHNNFQRQKIVDTYANMYSRKLLDDIEAETGGYFLEITTALLQPAHIYSARLLYYAISSRSYNRSIAVEIGLTCTASQLKVIRDAYLAEYKISLERDLNMKVEGVFGKMLQQLLLRAKDPEPNVDMGQVEKLLDRLKSSDNGVEEIGRNSDLFNQIFISQSLSQIRALVDRFDALAVTPDVESKPKDFESLVRKSSNLHSDVRHMILLYLKISQNVQLYFAEKLHEAVSGNRADHVAIIRILVMRSEIDLYDICQEYKRKYGRHLSLDLKTTCSGDFLRLLIQLLHPIDTPEDF
uniref:Annexin n=1 Tax=Acrobeloides nanus TaxID=290746 RepID=A0A914DVR4_9BILA